MADNDENQVELDVGANEETEVEVVNEASEDKSSEDQFAKAETSTQKRIDRLNKENA